MTRMFPEPRALTRITYMETEGVAECKYWPTVSYYDDVNGKVAIVKKVTKHVKLPLDSALWQDLPLAANTEDLLAS